MGLRRNVVGNAWMLFLLSGVALGAVTACGDDEEGDDSSSSGGKGSGGTSSGRGGSSGSSGDAGDAGEGGTATGGSSGSSGQGGSSGTETGGAGGAPGGMGGDAGDAGSAGDDPGGMGGMGGDPINYWTNGVTANGIDMTVDDRFHGVAVDASNNVYATGYLGNGVVTTGTSRQVVVAKFTSNAALAANFGNQGVAVADLSPYLGLPDDPATTTADDPDPSQEQGRDLALQSDGKIVVVGTVERNVTSPDRTTPIDLFVIRFDALGVRDATFNSNTGIHVLNPNGNSTNPTAYGVSIDATNRIYVHAHGTATHATRTDQDRYVYRLNADGTLDTNFGTGGFFTFDTPNNATTTLALSDNVRRGAVLPNGNVIISGYTNVAGRNQIVLARTTSAGVFDTTFSVDGVVRLAPFPLGMAECYGVGVQSDGSLVTTGYGNVDVERGTTSNFLDMVSFRVRPNGTADSTWGGNGAIALDLNAGEERGRAVMALPDDRIVIAGAGTRTAMDKDSMLVLLDKDGLAAEDFNADGTGVKLFGAFGSTGDEFFSLAQTPGTTGTRVIAAAGYAPTVGGGNGNLVIIPVPATP